MFTRHLSNLRDLLYFPLVILPVAAFAFLPGRLLNTGQGAELLANIVGARPSTDVPLIAIPFVFSMFCAAITVCLTAVPHLSIAGKYQDFVERYSIEIGSVAGTIATGIAFFPAFEYRQAVRLGFVDSVAHFAYEAGMCLVVIQLIFISMPSAKSANRRRQQTFLSLVARLLNFVVSSALYLNFDAPGERISEVVIVELLFVLVALILPTGAIRIQPEGDNHNPIEPNNFRHYASALICAPHRLAIAVAIAVLVTFAAFPSFIGVYLGTLLVFYAGLAAWSVLASWFWSRFLAKKVRNTITLSIAIAVATLALYTARTSTGDRVGFANHLGSSLTPHATPIELGDDYEKWNSHSGATDDAPTIIVLAEGGGIRAAYWTAEALKILSLPRVGLINRTYAIVGVSGGSLGAATFMSNTIATARAWDEYPDLFKGIVNPVALAGNLSTSALSNDLLGPWMARLMSTEALEKILPVRVFSSKGDVLQEGWADALKCDFDPYPHFNPMTVEKVCAENEQVFSAPMSDIPSTLNGQALPRLIFVATHVESGYPFLFSSVNFAPDDFPKTLTMESIAPGTVDLLSAAHASARFPLVSPPGVVHDSNGVAIGHVVDGGYVDASGALTASELINRLVEQHASHFTPIIVDLRNEPSDDTTQRLATLHEKRAGEFETIASTIAATRSNSSYFVRERLREEVCQQGGGYVTLKVRADKDGAIGLGWTLSREAQSNLSMAISRETKPFTDKGVKSPEDAMNNLKKIAKASCDSDANAL
jgi:hypothetical protein